MKKISQAMLAVTLIVIIIFFSGCSSVRQKTPSEVVEVAYMAANDGKYSEVKKYMSSELTKALNSDLGAFMGGLKGAWDQVTHNGTIKKIQIQKEEMRGEGADVYFKIYFKDGKIKDDKEELIKEDKKWKITIG